MAQVNEGEIPIFLKAGFWPVFFGDTLIGPQMPNLTYMIGFANLAERDKAWDAFRSAPETKVLFAQPKYTFRGPRFQRQQLGFGAGGVFSRSNQRLRAK